jgi:hypothetical protein
MSAKRARLLLIGIALLAGLAAWRFASTAAVVPEAAPAQMPAAQSAPAAAQGTPEVHQVAAQLPARVEPAAPPGPPTPMGNSPVVELPRTPPPENLPRGLRTPTANMTDAGIRFPLDRRGISAAMEEQKPQMKECYEQWQKLQPSLAGTMKIAFRIATDGGEESIVDQVRVLEDGGMGNVAFEGCVLNAVSDLRFEKPEGGGTVTVHYPIVFAASDAGLALP